ncbi:MAG TPA: hypothetical protein VE173_04755, partial [Longimicrobiales bacterium]|nr:hypothetical protein [Longimicrobiales bacterium]
MSEAARRGVMVVAGSLLAGLLLMACRGLVAFGDFEGHYGRLLVGLAPEARGTANVVTGVVFDFRAMDTL